MNLDDAVIALKRGGLVAFPTETVYGLGADAVNEAAVRRIFEAKQRPPGRPISILVGPGVDPARYTHWTPAAQALADAFWPGPLTIVLPRTEVVSDVVTGGQDTVGLRMPDHPVALGLIEAFGGGLATPSANTSGASAPTTADEVRADLGASVDVLLDGGTSRLGLASTVVSLAVDPPVVFRLGSVGLDALEQVLGVRPRVAAPVAPPGPRRPKS